MKKIVCVIFASFVAFSVFPAGKGSSETAAFRAPESIPKEMLARIDSNKDAFDADLDAALKADAVGARALLTLVDKRHALNANAVPPDLVALGPGKSYTVSREGLSLRSPAERALDAMARAARADGVTLVVSSTYRSFDYQKKIYERNVREMGELARKPRVCEAGAEPASTRHRSGLRLDHRRLRRDEGGEMAHRARGRVRVVAIVPERPRARDRVSVGMLALSVYRERGRRTHRPVVRRRSAVHDRVRRRVARQRPMTP